MGDQVKNGFLRQFFKKTIPYLLVIVLQFGFAGMYIITMVSLKHGMSNYVLVVYRHAVATLVIAPFALYLERNTRPRMTRSVFFKIMALAFLEPVLDQNLAYKGMKHTSATLVTAFNNVLPALTFILAIIFRVERFNIRQKHGVAKVIGTAITVTGALVIALYKGPMVDIFHPHRSNNHQTSTSSASDNYHGIGILMLLSSTLAWSSFFILQSITLRQYAAPLSLTALICLMGMVEGTVVAFVMEQDMSAWIIGFDSKLLAAVYSGIVCTGIAYYIQGFVSRIQGPVFVTAFSPLSMITTAILGYMLLAEKIYLGSMIGAGIIVFGLYSVLWGIFKDPVDSDALNSEQAKVYDLPVVDSVKSTNVQDPAAKAPYQESLTTVP